MLDLLLGSCLALLDRVARLHRLVVGELPSPDQANIVMLNVCEQVNFFLSSEHPTPAPSQS